MRTLMFLSLVIGFMAAGIVLLGCQQDQPKNPMEGDQPGECSDGLDNDGDGPYDCADPDCADWPECNEDDDAGDDDATDDDDADDDTGDDDTGDDDAGDDDTADDDTR